MKLSKRILASAAVVGALACAPSVAQAATVNVEEVHSEVNKAVLHFTAAPGETNHVEVIPLKAASPYDSPVEAAVQIIDTSAPLTAGDGCVAGGPGVFLGVICRMHPAHEWEYEPCGKSCVHPLPGTAWQDMMSIDLGDGNDTFDGSTFTGNYLYSWPMSVSGGSGDDTLVTGTGEDTITPGSGNDVVRPGPGPGINYVVADAKPDGNDKLEFASGSISLVDDSARSEPLHLANRVLGAAGEEDTISGRAEVLGGSGNDEFISSGEWLKGGPGNDTLIGSAEKDFIFGGPGNDTIRGEAGDDDLYGGEGDDTVEGGAGNDFIEEREEDRSDNTLLGTEGDPSTGNDMLLGGDGDDFVLAGPGDDMVEGGAGNDKVYGEPGNDTLEGGSGDDLVAGETGDDTLRGGEGDDELLAGYNSELLGGATSGAGVDVGVDSLDCGPGTDIGRADQWDHVENCETNQTVRAVMFEKVGHDRKRGTATVSFASYAVDGAVTFTVAGAEVNPVSYVAPPPVYLTAKGQFIVRARGAALAKLRRDGHVKLTLRLTWEQAGQADATETRQINLVEKKKPKAQKKAARGHHRQARQ